MEENRTPDTAAGVVVHPVSCFLSPLLRVLAAPCPLPLFLIHLFHLFFSQSLLHPAGKHKGSHEMC